MLVEPDLTQPWKMLSSTVMVDYEPGLLGAMPVARLVPAMLVEQVLPASVMADYEPELLGATYAALLVQVV